MSKGLIANAAITIDAASSRVWEALVSPAAIKQYMFGADVVSDWHEGSPIVWKGEWKGKPYEDKGVILRVRPREELAYSHYSPLTGKPDVPDSYHTVTMTLVGNGKQTRVSIAQDNNADDETRRHSEQNWATMLGGLKKFVESAGAASPVAHHSA
jgi:uncharacterized protein YndB with AHSA1/START domain